MSWVMSLLMLAKLLYFFTDFLQKRTQMSGTFGLTLFHSAAIFSNHYSSLFNLSEGPLPVILYDFSRNGVKCEMNRQQTTDRFLQAFVFPNMSEKHLQLHSCLPVCTCWRNVNCKHVPFVKMYPSFCASSWLYFPYFNQTFFFHFLLPAPHRCCPALPAVQRGSPELWDLAPGSFRCDLCVWRHHSFPSSITSAGPQTPATTSVCPAPTQVVPRMLHHQHPKLASTRASKEWRQAIIPTSLPVAHEVLHPVAGAARCKEQLWAGGAHRGPETTARGNTDETNVSRVSELSQNQGDIWVLKLPRNTPRNNIYIYV